MKKILALILMVGLAGQMVCADEFDDLATYKYGVSGAAEKAFNKVCVLKADEKPAVEQKLIAVLENKSGTEDGKVWACRCLQLIGTEASVPALSGLLGDKILSHYARLALESMVKSEAAGKALLDALNKTSGDVQIGIIGSIAERRLEEAVKELAKLAGKGDVEVAKAALMALGKIGDKQAKSALLKMDIKAETKQAHLDGLVECASRMGGKDAIAICEKLLESDSDHHRSAGLMGICMADEDKGAGLVESSLSGDDVVLIRAALTALVEVKGDKLTSSAVSVLKDADAGMQERIITVLGVRGDKSALQSVMAMLKSENKAVQKAALMSTALLGDANAVKAIFAMEGLDGKDVGKAIEKMTDPTVDSALISALDDAKTWELAVSAIISRNVAEAVPALLKLTNSDDRDARKAAWNALGLLTGEDKFGDLVSALREIKNKDDVGYGAAAIKESLGGINNQAQAFSELISLYDRGDDTLKKAVLELGNMAASSEALQLEIKGLNSGNADLAKVAVKAMSVWPNPDPADDLLEVAKTSKDEVMQILALRGYLAMAGSHQMKQLKSEDRIAMYKNAQGLVKEASEKRTLISGLRLVRGDEALKILSAYMNDEALKNDVEATGAEIIRHYRNHTAEAEKMAKVLLASKNNRNVDLAKNKLKEWENNKK